MSQITVLGRQTLINKLRGFYSPVFRVTDRMLRDSEDPVTLLCDSDYTHSHIERQTDRQGGRGIKGWIQI